MPLLLITDNVFLSRVSFKERFRTVILLFNNATISLSSVKEACITGSSYSNESMLLPEYIAHASDLRSSSEKHGCQKGLKSSTISRRISYAF